MKSDDNLIHLPDLSITYDSLKKHLKTLYNIDMSNPKLTKVDFTAFEKNVWGLEAEDIRMIEEEGNYDSGGHWNFSKINDKDYEAVYDGLYMHVFGSLSDLMARENEIHFYEYDEEASEENVQETFTDKDGNERDYSDKARRGKAVKKATNNIYEESNKQRLALINEMLADAEIIDPDSALELKADTSDIEDSEDKQWWAIDQLIDFNRNNTKIDEFIERAKALGWADQYAKNGKWFKEAVEAKAPYTLGGWSKSRPATVRRRLALKSRDQKSSKHKQYVSAGRALQSLANVTKDPDTKRAAKDDADYFFAEATKFGGGGGIGGWKKPSKKPDVTITGEIVEKSGTTTKTTPVTIHGYYYKTLNPLSSKKYRVLFYRDYYGVLFYEKYATFNEAYKAMNEKSHYYLDEINKAEKLEPSEIEYIPMVKAERGVEIEVSSVAKRYVDYYMEEDIAFIFDKLGMDMPTELEGEYFETEMDDARTFAEGYFTENPDEMTDKYGNPFAFDNGGGVSSEYVVDGTKKFYEQHGIGKAKYTVSFHDGVSTNKDGSAFYGIKTFHNKPDLEKFKQELLREGYVYKYSNGGGIPNNYIGKTKEQLWNSWTKDQRIHFIQDHDKNVLRNAEEEAELNYDDIHDTVISDWIGEHMTSGQYSVGGGVGTEHFEELYKKANNNVQGAVELYAGELGIYNMFYGHKVDPSKKAKVKKLQEYLERKYLGAGKAADGMPISADWINYEKDNWKAIIGDKAFYIIKFDTPIVERPYKIFTNKKDEGAPRSDVQTIQPRWFAHFKTAEEAKEFFKNQYGKAADGSEIDAMVTDWKNVKKALGGGGGMFDPKMLKAYDIETKSIHNIIKIDYDDDLIVMSSEKYGRTKNDLNKVKLFFEAGTEIQTPTPAVTTAAPIVTASPTPTPVVTPTPAVTTTKDANVVKQIPLAPKSQQVIKVDPTMKRSRFSKILQEMWAEAKGTGLTLISAEYMQKIEDALFTDATASTYEDMILEVMTWLIDNDIILRSKPFMKKIRTSFEDTQQSS